MSTYYPKTILASSFCHIQHELHFHDWKMSHKIPIATHIGPLNRHFQFFAYPEYDIKRNEVEAKTFDPTHILTNFRIHICKKGFQHVRANAFLEVCERNNAILSCGIITEEVDKKI